MSKHYIGRPCKLGHTLRYVINKTCVECDKARQKRAYYAPKEDKQAPLISGLLYSRKMTANG